MRLFNAGNKRRADGHAGTDAASAMTSSDRGLRDAPAYTTLAFSDATLHAYVQVNWEDDWFGAFVVGKTDTNVAVVYLEDDGRTDTSTPEAREEESPDEWLSNDSKMKNSDNNWNNEWNKNDSNWNNEWNNSDNKLIDLWRSWSPPLSPPSGGPARIILHIFPKVGRP